MLGNPAKNGGNLKRSKRSWSMLQKTSAGELASIVESVSGEHGRDGGMPTIMLQRRTRDAGFAVAGCRLIESQPFNASRKHISHSQGE